MKKSLTLIAMMVIVGFTLTFNTASVIAGNASNDKNNTNGNAYGHNKCKNKCKCNCELDVDLISIIVKQAVRDALDEAEADRLALAASEKEVTSFGTIYEDNASTESITDIEWRRNMWHKISDDAAYNAGYTGFDIIAYTKNEEAEAFVANSTEGISTVDITFTNANGEQLRLEGSMEMTEEAFSDRDYFLTK